MNATDEAGGTGAIRVPPAFDFVVEEGKCREFAKAVGQHELAAEGDALFAPPTFLTASQLWMDPEHSAWHGIDRDYRHVLHGEQRFDYPRGLPRVGTRYRARQRFGRAFEKQGSRGTMRFQEVTTSFWTRDEDDPDARMTSLSITLQAEAERPAAPASDPPRPTGATSVADPLDTWTTPPLTITDFVRYQGASGDFNPIHHDPDFARAGGHPSPFAVGMLAAGVAASQIGRVRDLKGMRSLRARWKAPAWPGDRLSYVVTEHAPSQLITTVSRQTGETHMIAWTEFRP